MLSSNWATLLAKNRNSTDHLQRVVDHALNIFRSVNADATLGHVESFINRRALIPRWSPGECKGTTMPDSAKLVNPDTLLVNPVPSPSLHDAFIPLDVQTSMVDFLVSEASVGPETAMSMIRFIAAKREEYRPYPPLNRVKGLYESSSCYPTHSGNHP